MELLKRISLILLILLFTLNITSANNTVASDTIQYSSLSESNGGYNQVWTEVHNITIPITLNGTQRISFNHKHGGCTGCYAKIYVYHNENLIYNTTDSEHMGNGHNAYPNIITFDVAENWTAGDYITIDVWDSWYYIVQVKDFTFSFDRLDAFNLTYPINGSNIDKAYPPLTGEVTFTWESNSSFSNIIVAKDINFNLIAVDTTTSNSYSTHSLEAGNYWWKLRSYNSDGFYYEWSNVSNFTLTNTITATGTGIDGTVYEMIGTTQTPISGATVYIYNNTLSQSMITGSNGYYLFDGLDNSTTYNVYVVKQDYDVSPTMPITTGLGTITTKDIAIKRTQPLFFDADKQYVLLKARWLYCISSCDIAGATISVYNSGESIPYATGTTDSTGSISFLLYKTQLYRITIVKSSDGVNKEETLYPKDNSYIFLITNSPISWKEHTIEQKDAITISVSRNIINSTHTYINVSYNDSLAQTTALNIDVTTNNTSVGSWSGSGNTSQSFIVSNYSGNSYLVKTTGNHITYGSLSETYSVFFEKSAVGISGIPEALWLWFMIAIMFFTAAIFTASTAELGLIIVCAEGWIGLALGTFSSINTTQFGIGLTLVSILGVLAYIKKQQAKEGLA